MTLKDLGKMPKVGVGGGDSGVFSMSTTPCRRMTIKVGSVMCFADTGSKIFVAKLRNYSGKNRAKILFAILGEKFWHYGVQKIL